MFCTECGQKNLDTATVCVSCGKQLEPETTVNSDAGRQQAAPLNYGFPPVDPNNDSGRGSMSKLPPQLAGWNWGAFFLNWIWGLGNNVLIALLCFIPLVNLVMIFVLGAKGNEWAWQNKRWNSIEHFKHAQKLWAIWGWILFGVGIIFSILMIIIALSIQESNYYYEY